MFVKYYEDRIGQNGIHTRLITQIGDLPTVDLRRQALEEITPIVEKKLGLPAKRRIYFGAPVRLAFPITAKQAKFHPRSELLNTPGCKLLTAWIADT